MLTAATVIAKHTSVLCNACKLVSGKASNPVAKKHFVQAAKDVANSMVNPLIINNTDKVCIIMIVKVCIMTGYIAITIDKSKLFISWTANTYK